MVEHFRNLIPHLVEVLTWFENDLHQADPDLQYLRIGYPWTQDVNWTYIRRTKDIVEVC